MRDVLSWAEGHEADVFAPRTDTALKVCDRFAGEVQPPVVLITEHGRPTEKLLGLVTPSDPPENPVRPGGHLWLSSWRRAAPAAGM